ncbi:MAG: hypothetical protein C0504_11215 [Candidatus Solibacter sp.]|nr:hypothetical protein [Candidatus Solibacter sp.]
MAGFECGLDPRVVFAVAQARERLLLNPGRATIRRTCIRFPGGAGAAVKVPRLGRTGGGSGDGMVWAGVGRVRPQNGLESGRLIAGAISGWIEPCTSRGSRVCFRGRAGDAAWECEATHASQRSDLGRGLEPAKE